MPRRDDIKKVLIIGSGPIVIGQACEFDYSGTQACKALRKLGYEIVLVNSNPATIMTDPGMADVTYIEPLNVAALTRDHREGAARRAAAEPRRPDRPEPLLGAGQRAGVLDKYGVKVIGVNVDAIERGEDREAFKETMTRLGHRHAAQRARLQRRGGRADRRRSSAIPVVIRPAYTMGGTGGGLVYNVEELADDRQPRPRRQPGRPDPGRGVGARLGGAGARGRPRRQEPDDHRLLHRERRRHGRAHRRLLLRRADADHRAGAAGSACRSTPTTSSRPSRSSAAPTSSSPTTRRPAAWWSSRSTRAPRAPRRWPPRPPASRSPSSPPCWPAG